jgi:EAL domain-containing protein (putative c-di-GMP-specific phosphodiesterase class I)
MLYCVCRILNAHSDLHLAVNLSSSTVSHWAWIDCFQLTLKDFPGVADRLTLEFTETAKLNPSAAEKLVTLARHLGVEAVALDDVGSGIFGLAMLGTWIARLKPDTIKIDCERVDYADILKILDVVQKHKTGDDVHEHTVKNVVFERVTDAGIAAWLQERAHERGLTVFFQGFDICHPKPAFDAPGTVFQPRWSAVTRSSYVPEKALRVPGF